MSHSSSSSEILLNRAIATIHAQRVAKASGNRPLGAAFSTARRKAREAGQTSHDDVLTHANNHLRSKGHPPIKKSVLSRLRALTSDEREDYGVLLEQGFSKEEARALAMAGTSGAVRKADTQNYHQTYVEQAKSYLPAQVHDHIHRIARARAGGFAKAAARSDASVDAKTDDVSVAQLTTDAKDSHDDVNALWRKRLAQDAGKVPGSDSDAKQIDKGGPSLGEVSNFGAPAGSKLNFQVNFDANKRRKVRRIEKTAQQVPIQKRCDPSELSDQLLGQLLAPAASLDALSDIILKAASPAQDVQDKEASDTGPARATFDRLRNGQDLVTLMDNILTANDVSVEEARQRASDQLARGRYSDGEPAPGIDGVRNTGGLRLHLNPGSDRQPGFLGFDTYLQDFGTVLHDIEFGLPVPDACADAIIIDNAFSLYPEFLANPLRILKECQRALRIGGALLYTGPAGPEGMWAQLPGLKVNKTDSQQGRLVAVSIHRVEAQLPSVFGAEPSLIGHKEQLPGDIERAEAQFGLTPPPAKLAMANLLMKSDRQDPHEIGVRVVKKDGWQQIVYGVVLAPDEEDSQGDVISAEEIQKTAHKYLAHQMVGQEHLGPMDSATVVESYIAPVEFAFDGQAIAKGAWVLGVHIADAKLWAKVLAKKFTGFSVGGFGDRTPLAG